MTSFFRIFGVHLDLPDVAIGLLYAYAFFYGLFIWDVRGVSMIICLMIWLALYLKTKEDARRGNEALIELTKVLLELQGKDQLTPEQVKRVAEALEHHLRIDDRPMSQS